MGRGERDQRGKPPPVSTVCRYSKDDIAELNRKLNLILKALADLGQARGIKIDLGEPALKPTE